VSIKINAVLAGASELSRAIKLANPATKAKVVATIKHHTQEVRDEARAAAPVVTGELVSTIRDEYSADGMTGYVKAGFGKLPRASKSTGVRHRRRSKAIGRGAYAPVINYGWRKHHIQANPFLSRPYQADQPQVLTDLSADLDGVVGDIAKAGA
jgi:hypothetical protein